MLATLINLHLILVFIFQAPKIFGKEEISPHSRLIPCSAAVILRLLERTRHLPLNCGKRSRNVPFSDQFSDSDQYRSESTPFPLMCKVFAHLKRYVMHFLYSKLVRRLSLPRYSSAITSISVFARLLTLNSGLYLSPTRRECVLAPPDEVSRLETQVFAFIYNFGALISTIFDEVGLFQQYDEAHQIVTKGHSRSSSQGARKDLARSRSLYKPIRDARCTTGHN